MLIGAELWEDEGFATPMTFKQTRQTSKENKSHNGKGKQMVRGEGMQPQL